MNVLLENVGWFLAAVALAQGGETSIHDICINQKTLSGCCSGRMGVMGITKDGVICQSGEYSPTCKREIENELSGCCSHHGGIQFIGGPAGEVVCNNGQLSPSCSATINTCIDNDQNQIEESI